MFWSTNALNGYAGLWICKQISSTVKTQQEIFRCVRNWICKKNVFRINTWRGVNFWTLLLVTWFVIAVADCIGGDSWVIFGGCSKGSKGSDAGAALVEVACKVSRVRPRSTRPRITWTLIIHRYQLVLSNMSLIKPLLCTIFLLRLFGNYFT